MEKRSNSFTINQLCGFIAAVSMTFLLAIDSANGQTPNRSADKDLRVLFVGNSLTYSNDLPEIVAALAKSARQKKLVFKTVAYPNFGLEDHWNKGEVQRLLAKRKWDYVILQQGPSASAEGRSSLIDYSKKFAGAIAAGGAKTGLFMVWTSADRKKDFAGVSASYNAAAKEAGAVIFPVAEAWLAAWKRDPKLALYSSDGFHPGPAGSYLAALVIYQKLYDQSPLGLSYDFRLRSGEEFNLSKEQARILQESAVEVNRNYVTN